MRSEQENVLSDELTLEECSSVAGGFWGAAALEWAVIGYQEGAKMGDRKPPSGRKEALKYVAEDGVKTLLFGTPYQVGKAVESIKHW